MRKVTRSRTTYFDPDRLSTCHITFVQPSALFGADGLPPVPLRKPLHASSFVPLTPECTHEAYASVFEVFMSAPSLNIYVRN